MTDRIQIEREACIREDNRDEWFYLPGFKKVHPMDLLKLLSNHGALHCSCFMDFQCEYKVWVTKVALRTLARLGWIVDCFWFVWSITAEGREKLKQLEGAEFND